MRNGFVHLMGNTLALLSERQIRMVVTYINHGQSYCTDCQRAQFAQDAPASLWFCWKCGHRSEAIDHFLFSCPLVHSYRSSFATTSLKVTNSWPPPLSAIPQNMDLWSVFRQFLRSSKRLSLSNASR